MAISYEQLVADHQGIKLISRLLSESLSTSKPLDANKLRKHLDDLISLVTDHLNMERELASRIERNGQNLYWGNNWRIIRDLSDTLNERMTLLSSKWKAGNINIDPVGFKIAVERFCKEMHDASENEISVFYNMALEKGLVPLR